MKLIRKRTFLFVSLLLVLPLLLHAEHSLRPLSYQSALAEYYSGYLSKIGDKELEEAYILLYPNDYEANEKDESKKTEDLKKVKGTLQKTITQAKEGTHEYSLMLEGRLGDYDKENRGFKCVFISSHNFMDIGPLSGEANLSDAKDNTNSVIAKALLFNKINKIKLFFSNTEEYNFLKYPAEKAERFNKSDKDSSDPREVFIVIDVVILPGAEGKSRNKLNSIMKDIVIQSEESNYFMLARIKKIEVYENFSMQNKMGEVAYRKSAFEEKQAPEPRY